MMGYLTQPLHVQNWKMGYPFSTRQIKTSNRLWNEMVIMANDYLLTFNNARYTVDYRTKSDGWNKSNLL